MRASRKQRTTNQPKALITASTALLAYRKKCRLCTCRLAPGSPRGCACLPAARRLSAAAGRAHLRQAAARQLRPAPGEAAPALRRAARLRHQVTHSSYPACRLYAALLMMLTRSNTSSLSCAGSGRAPQLTPRHSKLSRGNPTLSQGHRSAVAAACHTSVSSSSMLRRRERLRRGQRSRRSSGGQRRRMTRRAGPNPRTCSSWPTSGRGTRCRPCPPDGRENRNAHVHDDGLPMGA